ncbi:MAG: hypothetical protein ACYC5F_05915 [Thermoleophilia bacterium]
MGLALDILENEVRKQIAADNEVLKEARQRRDLIVGAAMQIEGSLRWFSSGSVAHAMVNRPVSDADSGIVLDRRNAKYSNLGPDGGNEGPDGVIAEIEELIAPAIFLEYPKAKISRSRRGLVVEFNAPVTADEDPSVDVIVTLTRKAADGLWIPDLEARDEIRRWTASHPEKHTELFTSGTKELRVLRARVARMAKAWNKQREEDDRALSSFNIAALALEVIDDSSMPLDRALATWFRYAHDELEKALTRDPAGISEPIQLLLDKSETVRRLLVAAEAIEEALDNEHNEEKLRQALRRVYPDYVEEPAGKRAIANALRTNTARVTAAGIAVIGGSPMKNTRSFGNDGNG